MQTHFDLQALARPEIKQADEILRSCVHCGLCTATCPTYLLTGDERDSPRGRIWMMRDLLGGGDKTHAIDFGTVGTHLDRCLTCLSCMTTCPSGVDYMHLVDIGRAEMGKTKRPVLDRLLRKLLVETLPHARRFHFALKFARLARPLRHLLRGRFKAMLNLAPKTAHPIDEVGTADKTYRPPTGMRSTKKVILLQGCAQRALAPEINAATIDFLTRHGVEVIVRKEAHCCGGLAHHIDQPQKAHASMRQTALAWQHDIESVAAIITNISGCGTVLKDYATLLAHDTQHAALAHTISALTMDITSFIDAHVPVPALKPKNLKVAYHSACSLQHGQNIHDAPRNLLTQAGFDLCEIAEPHLCCGSAGVYNILQPELSSSLQQRKINNINNTGADIIAAGNLGCITQLAPTNAPICHTIQLIDWAYGGTVPKNLRPLISPLSDQSIVKKSLPLSSMIMKAGKFSTSIRQTASMPSSANSKTSTDLIDSRANLAATPPIDPR